LRAVIAPEPGGPEALRLVERPDPAPGPHDLLVAVHATAVNRADVLQRKGGYPPPPGASDVLGLELAGTVTGVGAAVEGWSSGDRVCAIVPGGGYAETALVRADSALPVPEGLDWHEAAALPEVFATAYDNVIERGRLRPGETLLVHGGSSGVGTAAIQLAARAGADVLVTASSSGKIAACEALGARAGIDYRSLDFVEAVGELTGGRGADVILDIVGGPYLDRNLRALATGGRLVVIGLMAGARAELDMARLLTRRLTITASTLRSRSHDEKAALARKLRTDVWPGFADGSLRPVIDRVLPLERVAEAHARMESSAHIGKIVLAVR
jgi:NADPH:quinone reductase